MPLIKWPSIQQLRHVISNVEFKAKFTGALNDKQEPVLDHTRPLPTLLYRGTVKIHGTNAAIGQNFQRNEFWTQSRENVLTNEADNSGFNNWATSSGQKSFFEALLCELKNHAPSDHHTLVIFGEWAGKGIQKSAAVGKLDPFYTLFGACSLNDDGVEDGLKRHWFTDEQLLAGMTKLEHIVKPNNVYHTLDFPVFYESLDFSNPESFIDKLNELTLAIEKQCPVANALGVEGVGEGLVWTCVTPGWESPKFRFKLKGEKHQVAKNKQPAQISPEIQSSVAHFVEYSCTENRLIQGLEVTILQPNKKFTIDNVGDFLSWVVRDILKEESDTMAASNLDKKLVTKALSAKARAWFIDRMAPY